MRYARLHLIALLAVLGTAGHASAINIVFDYSLDTQNFFNTQAKRDVMDAAAAVFEIFTDQLAAITPGTVYNPGTAQQFTDTWTASFTHPGSGSPHTINNLSIAADTILVYAGGRILPGSTLGQGGPGGFNANGIQSFVDAVEARGQAGTLAPVPYDFGPWGGAITFDLYNDWHFDLSTAPANNETDFFSVAVHELAHLLGFGTATSFDVLANGTNFSGTNATSIYGSNPTLNFDQMHWAQGTSSTLPGGGTQESAMDPDIADGVIKQFTLLDFAALKDIGWEVPASIFNSLTGDLNSDGFVGIGDLNIVLSNWNQSVASGNQLLGDPSGDGYVGIDDLNTVLGNWNAGTPPTSPANVPEPASPALLIPAALALARRERAVTTH